MPDPHKLLTTIRRGNEPMRRRLAVLAESSPSIEPQK